MNRIVACNAAAASRGKLRAVSNRCKALTLDFLGQHGPRIGFAGNVEDDDAEDIIADGVPFQLAAQRRLLGQRDEQTFTRTYVRREIRSVDAGLSDERA